ncbi:conserved protein of unknown function [Tenacibaculum soleae]|uniref:hypothetical protein n=1 Tax=Tenacibaculum soleae TaxID=447689 RepID=UPI003AB6EB4B
MDDNFKYKLEQMEVRLSRKFTNKLQLKKRISPNKIFELFKSFIHLSDKGKSIFSSYSEDERKLLNSIQYSFEFCTTRHHSFSYNKNILDINKNFPGLTYYKNPTLENLSTQEINNIRAIIIIMQNENCFENFNSLLASKIISNNFYCEDKNSNNSVANNRKILKEHLIKSDKNNSKYTPIFSDVKLHIVKKYFN